MTLDCLTRSTSPDDKSLIGKMSCASRGGPVQGASTEPHCSTTECLTSNDFPPLEERCLLQVHPIHKPTQEHRQPQHDGREAASKVRQAHDGWFGEHVFALDMYQFLHLRKTCDLVQWCVMECCCECGRIRAFDRGGYAGEGGGDFVADEDSESAEMAMIFCFDANLDVVIFVKHSLCSIS